MTPKEKARELSNKGGNYLKTKQMDYKTELKDKMNQAGCTQKNLAEHLGIRQATISDYMTGKSPWNVDKYEQAIRYLNSLILKLP